MNLGFIDSPPGGPPTQTDIHRVCVYGGQEGRSGRRTNPLIYLDDLGRDHCTPELPSPTICKWPAAPHPASTSSAFAPTYMVHSEWVTRDGKAQGCAGAGAWAGCRPPKRRRELLTEVKGHGLRGWISPPPGFHEASGPSWGGLLLHLHLFLLPQPACPSFSAHRVGRQAPARSPSGRAGPHLRG